jgi:glycosyltransferase involved in cell wall biosynthesis
MSENGTLLVSVLVPIYNVEQYLGKTLDSIFTQTYQNVEYVFVNDCSPDNSLGVLKESINSHHIDESRYTIVCHEQNEGIAVSRADCIAQAKGDYVFFVDSDDWIEPDTVRQMVAATHGGTVDIVGCDFAKDYVSGKTTYHTENYADTCRENMLRCLNYDIATVLWKLLIRRSLFDNITITPHVDIVEDYIISVKLYYFAESFAPLHKVFYHYVQYNQERVSLQTLRSITMHIKGVKEVEDFLNGKGLYDDVVRNKMNLRKFNIRSNFVLNKSLMDAEAYRNTFPETAGVWRQMNYSTKEKVKFWMAEHGLFPLLKLLLK